METKQVEIRKLLKGRKVVLHGVTVLITKRERWNMDQHRISFVDCGNGLPSGYERMRIPYGYFRSSMLVEQESK